MHRNLPRQRAKVISSLRQYNINSASRQKFSSNQKSNMTLFFPRVQHTSPFFHLLNEIDHATRSSQCQPRQRRHQRSSFTPSFDVKEAEDSYQLYGELPGLSQSDINIEWADDKTITISGHTERNYKSTNAESQPEASSDAAAESANATTEEDFEEITNDQASYHKPSVEDEVAEGASPATAEESEKAVESKEQPEAAKQPEAPKHKYWVSERSIGSFQRTFQFPVRVEHDEVKASLQNGILSVTIPKAKPLEPRKITIN